MDFVVVSGFSGAGKSTALRALEDAGFFTSDNLPPQMWVGLHGRAVSHGLARVAVCTDARTRAFLADVPACWDALKAQGGGVRLVFLEASDEVLLRRYNLTRRTHPLGESSLMVDFARERELLGTLRERADNVIDTTDLAAQDLARRVLDITGHTLTFDLRLMSFGFKHAPPRDADLVLDVRGLPNPYYVEALRHRTGREQDVADHVFSEGDAYYEALLRFVRDSASMARASGRRSYNIAIGCTGGQHRSVAVAERLARDLTGLSARVVDHRDIRKGEAQ